jgi:hypothetical protein
MAEDRVFWTDAATKLDRNRLGANTPPLPALTEANDMVRRACSTMKEEWRLALMKWREAGTEPLRLELEKYFVDLHKRDSLPEIDLEKEAALATLTPPDARRAFVARWLSLGFETSLEILTRMWGYVHVHELRRAWLVIKPAEENWDSTKSSAKVEMADLLARHVRSLPDDERALVRAAGAKLRENAPLTVRIGLARALDDADFANEDARVLLAQPAAGDRPDAKFLMRLVSQVDHLEQLVEMFGFDSLAFRPEIVARRVGVPAAPLLIKQLANAKVSSYASDVATYLATLECRETARAFAPYLAKRGLGLIAKEFFERRPDIALRAVDAKTVKVLRELGVIPDQTTNDDDQDDVPEVPEADASELPQVLVDPFWKTQTSSKGKVTDVPTLAGLKPLPFEEKILLSKEERDLALAVQHSHALDDDVVDNFVADPDTIDVRYIRLEPRDVLNLLARCGLKALPFIFAIGKHTSPSQVVTGLIVVSSPTVGVYVGEIGAKEKVARPAVVEYFTEHAEASAIGLVRAALSKKSQKAALAGLQFLHSQKPDVVREVAKRYGPKVEELLPRLLEWEGPTRGPAKSVAPPAWVHPERLPAVLLANKKKRLPESAVRHLVTLLMLEHKRMSEVLDACHKPSLARFAWSVFQVWLSEGADPKDDWALTSLGPLGDDEVARRLSPLVRAWPGEGLHARAVKGLDVLAAIGSDLALMNLDAIAEKVKFKALQERARKKIEEIALQRNLSREQLADRIAPTLDLDPDGSRVLTLSDDRKFRVGFDENLVPFVIAEDGKRLADLPKTKGSSEATETWKGLKKDAKAIAQTQILRFERAMIAQRRWPASELKKLFIDHPLMFHLARRVVWATFDGKKDKLTSTFRVAEDRSLANVDDDAFTLLDNDAVVVGIPHRLELTDADERQWGELFGNYEIVQPFPQLSREVFEPTEIDRQNPTVIARFAEMEVTTRKVLGLTSRGWRLGPTLDAGWIWSVVKPLPGTNLTATLSFNAGGLYIPNMAESPPTQQISAVTVFTDKPRTALQPLSAIQFSELVRDLDWLRS